MEKINEVDQNGTFFFARPVILSQNDRWESGDDGNEVKLNKNTVFKHTIQGSKHTIQGTG